MGLKCDSNLSCLHGLKFLETSLPGSSSKSLVIIQKCPQSMPWLWPLRAKETLLLTHRGPWASQGLLFLRALRLLPVTLSPTSPGSHLKSASSFLPLLAPFAQTQASHLISAENTATQEPVLTICGPLPLPEEVLP